MQHAGIDDDRRRTIAGLAALTSACLIGTAPGVHATRLSNALRESFRRSDELAGLLRGKAIDVEDWRTGLNDLFGDVELEEILQDIDFQALAAATGYASLGVKTVRVRQTDGSSSPVHFTPRFFAIGAGRAIIPHGHRGMVSAHLVLNGHLRLRQYDTLGIEADHLALQPTVDRAARAGDLSSIGLTDDNTHWFVAEENSHTLDTIVTGLGDPAEPAYEIFNVDMDRAERTASGILLAPRLDVQRALRRYG